MIHRNHHQNTSSSSSSYSNNGIQSQQGDSASNNNDEFKQQRNFLLSSSSTPLSPVQQSNHQRRSRIFDNNNSKTNSNNHVNHINRLQHSNHTNRDTSSPSLKHPALHNQHQNQSSQRIIVMCAPLKYIFGLLITLYMIGMIVFFTNLIIHHNAINNHLQEVIVPTNYHPNIRISSHDINNDIIRNNNNNNQDNTILFPKNEEEIIISTPKSILSSLNRQNVIMPMKKKLDIDEYHQDERIIVEEENNIIPKNKKNDPKNHDIDQNQKIIDHNAKTFIMIKEILSNIYSHVNITKFTQKVKKKLVLLRRKEIVDNNLYSCRQLFVSTNTKDDASSFNNTIMMKSLCYQLLFPFVSTSNTTTVMNNNNISITNKKRIRYIYYNPIQRERYICGHRIKAYDILILNEICNEPTSTLFSITPNRINNNNNMNDKTKYYHFYKQYQNGLNPLYSNIDISVITRFDYSTIDRNINLYTTILTDSVNYQQDCDVPCINYGNGPSINSIRYIDPIDKTYHINDMNDNNDNNNPSSSLLLQQQQQEQVQQQNTPVQRRRRRRLMALLQHQEQRNNEDHHSNNSTKTKQQQLNELEQELSDIFDNITLDLTKVDHDDDNELDIDTKVNSSNNTDLLLDNNKMLIDSNNNDDNYNIVDTDAIWQIIFSMEGEGYYPNLLIDSLGYLQNKYYSTTSFQSDIPLPYFSWSEYNIQNANIPISFEDYNNQTLIRGASFIARNCGSLNNRESIVQQLIDYVKQNSTISLSFRFDSLSSCLNNIDHMPNNNITLDNNKVDIIRQYMFHLAFENQNVNDYITEKLWQPFVAGVIPIYYGSPNIKEHVPSNSIIHIDDYMIQNNDTNNTTQDSIVFDVERLVNDLIRISYNKELYESYHSWRYQELPKHFIQKYNMTHIHSSCRTCRWAYAKMYGLGWDHIQQHIENILQIGISRNACIQMNRHDTHNYGLLIQPFQEEWWIRTNHNHNNVTAETDDAILHQLKVVPVNEIIVDAMTPDSNTIFCELDKIHHTVLVNEQTLQIQRHLYEHDGIIDMYIEQIVNNNPEDTTLVDEQSKMAILRIKTLIQRNDTTFQLIQDGYYRLQNHVSRLSVLIWPSNNNNFYNITMKKMGVIDIELSNTVMFMKIRFISENVDTFHHNADIYDNFFGKLMINDFFHPIEPYLLID